MDDWGERNGRDFGHTGTVIDRVRERMARASFPRRAWPFVRLHWARLAYGLLLLLGIAVQFIVIGVVYGLVDLSISLMEVWAELARKHLELTL